MNIGQLYYFAKKVEELKNLSLVDKLESIEIYGLNLQEINFPKSISNSELKNLIKDYFIPAYSQSLEENKLAFASKFWQKLTSPKKFSGSNPSPKTDYQIDLLNWLNSDQDFPKFLEIIQNGWLTTDLEDYTCFYGLLVIDFLTHKLNEESQEINQFSKPLLDVNNLSSQSEILIFTEKKLSPIFQNFNCQTVLFGDDAEENLSSAQSILQKNPEIKLVLLTNNSPETLALLEKRLPEDVLVAEISFNQEDSGYFDNIVKKTLGVRLT